MSLYPLWEEVTPQCASSKWNGTLSQCCSSPTVWVALRTAVVDLLCVEPSPIICLIGRIRRPTQRWKGQLLWRWDMMSLFPPSVNEGYICKQDVPFQLVTPSHESMNLGPCQSTLGTTLGKCALPLGRVCGVTSSLRG